MQILRTIVRVFIITIAVGLLIFLSVSLFKLIPAGIEQLASATVSLGKRTSLNTATTTDTQRTAQPAPVSEDGLNGVYDSKGDIVILDERTVSTSSSNTTAQPASTPRKSTRTYTTYRTTYSSTGNTYYNPNDVPPEEQSPNGGKNLKVTFASIGVIRNGQFIKTNTFNTNDTVSMHFTIINEEDTPTGPWAMRVEMPALASADKVKVLTNLDSIPGESSYTGEVRFDGIDLSQGAPVIRVILDIYNQVAERNENDNILAVQLNNVTNNSYYYNNYNNCTNGTYYNGYYSCNNPYYTNNTNCANGGYYNNGYYTCYTNWYDNTGYYNNNYGTSPNLYISSLEIGRIINGSFYAQTTFNYGDQITVRAHVRNNGGYTNNSWISRLNIYDANNYSRDISNGTESPIAANGESVITYTVDGLARGSNRLTFYADSSNNISESNESDNSSQINVQVY